MKAIGHFLVIAIACSAWLPGANPAAACNVCVEDKIAATYDWQVVSEAKRNGHIMIFAAISGRITPGDETMARAVRRLLSTVGGVHEGTVRVSLAPAAASFACDRRRKPSEVVQVMNRRLRRHGLALTIVRIGAPQDPVVGR